MHDAVLALSLRQRRVRLCICLSVRPSVCHTPVLCLAEQKQDCDSPMILVSGKV